MNRGGTGTNY